MNETALMHQIMLKLSEAGHAVFRGNVGMFYTKDGRPVQTGLPKGFSDLFGMTKCGKFFAVEVKTPTGKLRKEQSMFLNSIEKRGGISFVARSPEQALHEMQKRTHIADVSNQQMRQT